MIAAPSDLELVLAARATYDPAGTPYFEDVERSVCVFLTRSEAGMPIIAVEGTHNALGWALDFLAASIRDQQGLEHRTLGFVHAGFYASAVSALARCALIAAKEPYAICGHSLGAALALLIGAMLTDDGVPPAKVAAFAPPRVGGDDFVKVATSVPLFACRYGVDPVTEVPFTLRPLYPYRQVPLIALPAAPVPALDVVGRLACHEIENYVAGVKALAEQPEGGTDGRPEPVDDGGRPPA